MKKFLLALMLFLLINIFSIKEIQAQEYNIYSANDIFAETYPEIPGSYQKVDIELVSYLFNLNNHYISWFINGEKELAGYGEYNFEFETKAPGETISVSASIEVGDQTFRKNFKFTPAEVDILWEAIDAYESPFYRGKPLYLKGGKLRLTAIPETQLIAPTDAEKLIYYWNRNGKRDQAASGFGKNSYEFTTETLLEEDEIELTTNDRQENSFAQKRKSFKPFSNEAADLLFYEINSNGKLLLNKALNDFSLIKGSQIHLSFHPISLSTIAPNFIDTFVGWNINGENQAPQDFSKQNELAISTAGESGSVQISLELEPIDKYLQNIKEQVSLNFIQ